MPPTSNGGQSNGLNLMTYNFRCGYSMGSISSTHRVNRVPASYSILTNWSMRDTVWVVDKRGGSTHENCLEIPYLLGFATREKGVGSRGYSFLQLHRYLGSIYVLKPFFLQNRENDYPRVPTLKYRVVDAVKHWVSCIFSWVLPPLLSSTHTLKYRVRRCL